ncbi:MAG: beta-glucanase/beta-glucan synthetase [Firmicutes bacterium]|nr:beta-glucanase/beta-glucan synthetase [Bacillota bacterium]
MRRFYFVFLIVIGAIGMFRGDVYGDSLSLTANTIQMEQSTAYDININGKILGLTYYWTTSDNNIVTVNSKNGKIYAKKDGEARISCFITSAGGVNIKLTCKVVVGVDASGPRLKNTKLELRVGEQYDINIARKIKQSKYKWSSSKEAVIDVNSSNGFVTAVGKGQAKITCTITAPNKKIIILLAAVNVTQKPANLIWEDNFNTPALDHRKWDYEYGHVRNLELQNYTDRVDNVSLRDGYLVIKALKDKDGAWTSASIHTNNRLEVGNARIEARIKVPYESGAFPAFWMLGADYEFDYREQRGLADTWLEAREIDIMETFGKVLKAQGGVFIKSSSGATALSQFAAKSQDIDITKFHTYAVEKSDTAIKFYCDDNLYYAYAITDDGLKDPFYILLNLAVGAAGGIPDPTITEMELLVDYVRVTALEGVPLTEPESITLDLDEWRGNVGNVKKVNVKIRPMAAQDRTVTWISSDPSVATVYGGYVRIKKTGTCIISATTANGLTATMRVVSNS